jgi:predicted dehydrogenase
MSTGSSPRPATLRVGVVGGGLIAQLVHLRLLAEHAHRFTTVALVEPSRAVREELRHRYGIGRAYADHGAMLDDGDLDAVVVASPNGTHADVVLDCLEHGLDVLVEKPLCLELGDADRIIEARDRSGGLVQVGYMKRFDPAYEALLADLARDGGEIDHVTTVTHDPGLARLYAPADFARGADVPPAVVERVRASTAEQVRRAVGSGDVRTFSEGFLGALIHDVNLVHGVLDVLGRSTAVPRLASASAGGRVLTGVVELDDGATWTMAWLLLPGLRTFAETLTLYSPRAIRTLRFPAPYARHAAGTYGVERAAETSTRVSVGSHRESYARQLAHFHDCIRRREPCRTPPEQARRDIALLTALFQLS